MTNTIRSKSLLVSLVLAVILAVGSLVLVEAKPAKAAFPGQNGKIAFESSRDGNEEIYVMKADGKKQKRLTNNPALDLEPAFSPDGSKIAFTSNRDGNANVYVMNSNGSNPTRITNDPVSAGSPAFSPDGTKIAFRSGRDGGISNVYVMNSDGSSQKRLTKNQAQDSRPDWGVAPSGGGHL